MNNLLLLASIILMALMAYAFYLWAQVWRKRKQQQATILLQQETQVKKEQAHQDYLIESITVISQSAVNGELNVSEACIRAKVLLDNLAVDDQQKAPFSLLDDVFVQLQQFHTHDARLRLSDKERISEDRKRHFIELKHQAELLRLFKLLTETQWQ